MENSYDLAPFRKEVYQNFNNHGDTLMDLLQLARLSLPATDLPPAFCPLVKGVPHTENVQVELQLPVELVGGSRMYYAV